MAVSGADKAYEQLCKRCILLHVRHLHVLHLASNICVALESAAAQTQIILECEQQR